MRIGDIFTRSIDRPIEGVIKADDDTNLATEVDEYVLTGETAAAMEDLLETYAGRFTGGNGVWISGFFGSGKSHLLKMLAHLLGNVEGQTISRQHIVDQFADKTHGDNPILASLLAKAAQIPATSLLFNIDQKATLISKDQTDALLRVFVKVFNEARGYYGNQPHIARFEHDLDRRGLYPSFKQSYQQIAGRPWEQGRESGILEDGNVAKAYSQVVSDVSSAPESILKKYRDEFALSIEDFAEDVAEWLATQPEGLRLLFLVDEVGQFIGTNTKLMLNLQTIVESLNTRCKGRAWVFVTSQEDMDQVIGDQDRVQANDFSKIQARFATRMKLTSRDVQEVIEKRLLDKTDGAKACLRGVYDEQQSSFRTLFDFVDGAKTYRNYTDVDVFCGMYPFVPYQIPFFQDALVGLSKHNAFTGRQYSVGERSLLAMVQEAAQSMVDQPVGALVPFDAMFAGIRASVKSAATRNVGRAEQHLPGDSTLAVRLLKALFLVKYVEGFNATPRNLAVLMYAEFGSDIAALHQQVQAALDLLEQQTYIQRNGNMYEYLTDEEQEIEQEIKNTDVDPSEISKLLVEIIRTDVAKLSSYTHQATGRVFKYGLKLDDISYGIQQPLAVHYITPAFGQTMEVIQAQSFGRDELRVILSDDQRLYQDLRLWVQTDKYVKRKRSTSLTANQSRILDGKGQTNVMRRSEMKDRVATAICDSLLVFNGAELTSTATNPETKIADGMAQIIARIYHQLSLLGDINYPETGIAAIANEEQSALVDRMSDKLQPVAEEIATFVMAQRRLGTSITVKKAIDHFEDKPYGWPWPATLSGIARLFATGQIVLGVDSRFLKRSEVAETLRNTAKHAQTVISEQKQFDPVKVQEVRAFAAEFFAEGGLPSDPLELAATIKERLASKQTRLQTLRDAYHYPFIVWLDQPLQLLAQTAGHPADWYLDTFAATTGDLLDAKRDAIDPIEGFFSSAQKTIWDAGVTALEDNRVNLRYIPTQRQEALGQLPELLANPDTLRGNGITRVKDATAKLRAVCDEVVAAERDDQHDQAEARWGEVQASAAYTDTTQEARDKAEIVLRQVIASLQTATQIPDIRAIGSDFAEQGYASILNIIEQGRGAERLVVSIRSLPQPKTRGVLETNADVDGYLGALGDILRQTINDGKVVSL